MLINKGKFNRLSTMNLIKIEDFFLLYNGRLSKFKALQIQILR